MNTAVLIIQGALALFFLFPAFTKILSGKKKLIEKKMAAPGASVVPIKIIGFLELLGSIGIITSYLTNIAPILTPIAAIGFTMIMVGAIIVHVSKKDYKTLPMLVIILVLSVIVAWYRIAY
jgi:uncharacterized membrane protein YphA (DoxX/SURF4 family)